MPLYKPIFIIHIEVKRFFKEKIESFPLPPLGSFLFVRLLTFFLTGSNIIVWQLTNELRGVCHAKEKNIVSD